MRFTIAYYILLLYLTVMFQPLIPIAYDAWSHAFAEAYHISTVHAKYGSHHLEVSMAKANENDNSKNQNSVKAEDQAPVHVSQNEYNYKFCLTPLAIQFSSIQQSKLLSVFILKHTPPPKFF